MAIPTSGAFSDATVRAEWTSLSLPMTSAQLATAAGLGAAYSSENLRGKSAINTGISSNITDQNVGGSFRATRGTMSIYVLPSGAGTPTGHSWTITQDDFGMAFISNAGSAVATFEGPQYDINTFTYQGSFTVQCVYFVNGTQFTRVFNGTYTLGQLM